jgi:hypothetical protein
MRLPLAALVVALATGCASAPIADTPAAAHERQPAVARYFPLAVGNTWTYQTRFGGKVERNTVRIESKEGRFFRDNQRGALAFDGEGLRDERRYLILGPLEPGRAWESRLEDGKTERYEIVRTDATVQVPAGRFDDVLVVRGITPVDAATNLEIEWSYAPGVGLVRMASTAVVGGRERLPQAEIELLSFRLSAP